MKLESIQEDMRVAEGIAMFIAPYDTGNLRFNAIKSQLTADGFRVKYSLADAFYIYFLEEGTRKTTRHKGFIANKTVPTIASYISAKHKQKSPKLIRHFKMRSHLATIDTALDTRERDIRNMRSLAVDVNKIAKDNQWAHNPDIEIFDENFESRRLY